MPAVSSRRIRRAFIITCGVLLTAFAAGAGWHAVATRRDMAQFPPPGRLVDIGGRRLHLHCIGQGAPTVVLEAGLGNDVNHWSRVQPMLAAHTRVCAYDRAGLGWSDPGPMPRSAERVAADLARLLERSGEPGPYVLVGHSNGGLYARLHAATHPTQVAGLVLVDPNSELIDPCPPLPTPMRVAYGGIVGLAPVGAARALLPALFPLDRSPLPPDARPAHGALRARTAAVRALWSETREMCPMLATMRAAPPLPPTLPVVLLSAERKRPEQQPVFEHHRRMAASWPRGEYVLVRGSGHWIQLDRPEAVVDAVRRVLAAPLDQPNH